VGGGGYQRIVSLKPNITEILFALGVGDRVVGVTTWCHYPEAAKKLPKVGDYLRAFPEQVVAVRPDLIIGSKENSAAAPTLQLEQMGFKMALFPFTTLDDTVHSIRGIGALVGQEAAAEKIARTLTQQFAHLRKTATSAQATSVLAVVGHRPLIVAGPQTFLGQVFSALGLRNVIDAGSLPYPQLNTESLLALNPAVILDLTMGTEAGEHDPFWQRYPQLQAVRDGRVIAVTMDDFRAGPRLGEGLQHLATRLHTATSSK
jgi:iron complex transport system substrate-binding protein